MPTSSAAPGRRRWRATAAEIKQTVAQARLVVDQINAGQGTVFVYSGQGAQWAGMRIHLVRNPIMADLGYSSKLNAEWAFLTMLRDEGRRAGATFLAEHGADLGRRSSLDIDQLLDGS